MQHVPTKDLHPPLPQERSKAGSRGIPFENLQKSRLGDDHPTDETGVATAQTVTSWHRKHGKSQVHAAGPASCRQFLKVQNHGATLGSDCNRVLSARAKDPRF